MAEITSEIYGCVMGDDFFAYSFGNTPEAFIKEI